MSVEIEDMQAGGKFVAIISLVQIAIILIGIFAAGVFARIFRDSIGIEPAAMAFWRDLGVLVTAIPISWTVASCWLMHHDHPKARLMLAVGVVITLLILFLLILHLIFPFTQWTWGLSNE